MANTRHQEVDEAGKGDLEIVWMRVAVARLKMSEAMECAPERSSHVDSLGTVEVEACERTSDHIDDAFDCRLQFVIASAWISIGGGIEAGRVADNGSPRIAECTNSVFTSDALRSLAEPFGEQLPASQTEAANQVVVAVNMTVKRWLLHTEGISDPRERDSVESFGIGEASGFVDHLCRGKGSSTHALLPAWRALMTATFTMSSTQQPRLRSCRTPSRPWSNGPNAWAPPSRSVIL